MPRRIITLLTDFGLGSPNVAAMKGVILSINPEASLVDLSHTVAPQDITQGALTLADASRFFPPGTIHVAVVDPKAPFERQLVWCRIGEQEYVGPDNGLFSFMTQQAAPDCIVALTEPQYWLPTVSSTFHGRDIMAPVAAHLSLGLEPRLLGNVQEKLVELPWPKVEYSTASIKGAFLRADLFGNLITNISAQDLKVIPPAARVRIHCAARTINGIAETYGGHALNELIALVGSSGRLEIAIVDGNAAATLRVKPENCLEITWT